MRRIFPILALAAFAGLSYVHLSREIPRPAGRFPMPTEHRLDTDAEKNNRAGRKQWIAQMHRTAPGTDWKAIERANGLALQAHREGLDRDTDKWSEIGSRNQAGRMHCATISVAGDSLYAGSDRGGLWKADLWGNGWRPLSDNVWGGVHQSVVAAGVDPEVITIQSASQVMIYSEDMGATWQTPTGFNGEVQQAKRILRDPASTDRVYALVAIFAGGTQLYRSDDAGRTYQLVNMLNASVGDFWIDRRDGNDLYLMINKTLHRSLDLGETWTQIGVMSSTYNPSQVILAGSEAGAPTFYVAAKLAGNWELWRSIDGGVNWEFRYDIDDFWETMNCSITQQNVVMFAGVEAWRSNNGGSTFTKVNGWGEYYGDPLNKLHADNPGLDVIWFDDSEHWFPGTDGGLYRSDDVMLSVLNLSMEGLGVSQYYTTHTSNLDPYRIAAGSQDQGYQRGDGLGRDPQMDFDQLISGDYAHLTSGDGSHSIVFSVYPGFVLVHHGEYGVALHYLDFPPGESYPWLPFIVGDPDNLQDFFFGAKKIYCCHWSGGDIETYTEVSSQNFAVDGAAYVTAISIAPGDHSRWIAVTNNGNLWYSSDSGATWTQSDDDGPSAHYFYGTGIEHSDTNPLEAWICGSGYDGPAVYRTLDGGVTWTAESFGLPSTLAFEIVFESPGSDVLYTATENGPYRFDPGAQAWQYIGGTEAPLTTYWCVEAVPSIGAIRFGTYGRGIWDYDTSGSTGAPEDGAPLASALSSFPNPFNPQTTLSFALEADGPVRLSVFDPDGRRVRILADGFRSAGQQRISWDGRDDRGNSCSSGVYLALLEADGIRVSSQLTLLR